MSDSNVTIQELKNIAQQFVQDRDWMQFHNPKNLSMQIAAEAAELMEHFLWMDGSQSVQKIQDNKAEIQQEIADVFIGILMICQENGIDLSEAFKLKMAINTQRYPVEKAKGRSEKYSKL